MQSNKKCSICGISSLYSPNSLLKEKNGFTEEANTFEIIIALSVVPSNHLLPPDKRTEK